jgi:aspartate-semialdehyde dehydrogenase
VESAFAKAGYAVLSNSKNHRMDDDVPLLVPEINPEHLALIAIQQKNHRYESGYIVTNPNCSTMALVLALAPLEAAFGIEKVHVVTMQALSGAGYPGVASLDIIETSSLTSDEEEKVETEPARFSGNSRRCVCRL